MSLEEMASQFVSFGGKQQKAAQELPFELSTEGVTGEPENTGDRLEHFSVLISRLGEKQASSGAKTILYDLQAIKDSYKKLYGIDMVEDTPDGVRQIDIVAQGGKISKDFLLTMLSIASKLARPPISE